MLIPNRGFTIIEILTVVVVIGILAGLSTVGYRVVKDRAVETDVKADSIMIADSLELYFAKNKQFPTNLSDLGTLDKSTNTSLTYESNGTSYCLNTFNTKPGLKTYTIRDNQTVREGDCGGWVPNAGTTTTTNPTTPPPAPSITAPSGTWTLGYTVSTVRINGENNERYVITASGSLTCATGTLQWKLGVTGGSTPAWSSVAWQTANTRTVDVPHTGIYSAFDVTIFAKARCVNGADSAEGSAKYVYRGSGGGTGGAI